MDWLYEKYGVIIAKFDCANCGERYSSFSPVSPNWCKKDGLLFCRKCATSKLKCPSCKGKVSPVAGTMLLMGIMMAITFSAIMPIFAFRYPTIVDQYKWNSMDTTKIEDLTLGDEFKIEGIIESEIPYPINVTREERDSDSTKITKEFHDFDLNDGTGTIRVNMSEYRYIIKYRNDEFIDDTEHYWYENGDKISLVGDVRLDDEGNITLYPEVAAPSSDGYFMFVTVMLFGMLGGSALIGVLLAILGYFIMRRRLNLHQRNMENVVVSLPSKRIIPEPLHDIQWHENSTFFRTYFWGKVNLVITIVLVILGLYLITIGLWFGFFMMSILIVFPGVFAFVFLFFNRYIMPTHIGFDNNGIHVRYKAQKPHSLFLRYIGWSEIESADHSVLAGTSRIIFQTVDGREMTLSNFSKALTPTIMEEINRRIVKEAKEEIEPMIEGELEAADHTTLTWEMNDYRKKGIKRITYLAVLQIALLPLPFWFISNYGMNRGVVLFFYPGLITIAFFFSLFWMPSRLAITETAVYIKKKKEVTKHDFSKIHTLSAAPRGIKFTYRSKLTKSVDFITPTTTLRIMQALEGYNKRKGIIVSDFSGNADIKWHRNRAYTYYHHRFVIPIYITIIYALIMLILTYLSYIELWLSIIMIVMPSVFLIFLIMVWFPLKHAPIEVGFSIEGLHCKYKKREYSKVLLNWIAWKDIEEIDFKSGPEDYFEGPNIRSGKGRNYVHFQKNTGITYLLGPIDDEILGELSLKCQSRY